MSGETDAVVLLHQRGYLVERKHGGVGEQILLQADGVVLFIGDDLVSENIHAVGDADTPSVHVLPEGHGILQTLEETHNVDVLGGGELHARDGNDSLLFRRLVEGGAVLCGLVVGKCRDLQAGQRAHTRDVIRGHVVVGAGREAGVDVEIVVVAIHKPSSASFFAAS